MLPFYYPVCRKGLRFTFAHEGETHIQNMWQVPERSFVFIKNIITQI